MIEGVKVKTLRVIPDERGRLMEILRADDDSFLKFGQVYGAGNDQACPLRPAQGFIHQR
jgi:dTDP-4-dehydrorhamnose 3,5-epimerase